MELFAHVPMYANAQVKNMYRTFITVIEQHFEGEKDSSTQQIRAAIASAQNIENYAMHAKSRVSPYQVNA